MSQDQVTIMYASQTPEHFRYRVVLWSSTISLPIGFWWVHDTKCDTFRKIGRVGAKRTNYFDRAVEFCIEKQAKEPTERVVFRRFSDGDIIALFPDDVDYPDGRITSYMHVGQHGGADYCGVLDITTPAEPGEYQDLQAELESIGYRLQVVNP